MKKYIFAASFVVITAALATGYFFFQYRGKSSEGRGLASVGDDMGPSGAEGLKITVLENASVETVGDETLIHIGAFENICASYPKVEILLRAEGVAVEGEAPTIKISRLCERATANASLAPITVPVKYLKNLEPDDQRFTDDRGQVFEIKNAAGVWPDEWHVYQIHLSDPSSGAAVDIDSYEINYILKAPLVVSF